MRGVPEAERLGDGQRAIDEVRDRRDQREVDVLAGEVVQRDQRLERGDAAPGDDHTRTCGGGLVGHEARLGRPGLPVIAAQRGKRSLRENYGRRCSDWPDGAPSVRA